MFKKEWERHFKDHTYKIKHKKKPIEEDYTLYEAVKGNMKKFWEIYDLKYIMRVDNPIILTKEQQSVFDNVVSDMYQILHEEWVSDITDRIIDIQGYAGTGKTTLSVFLIKEILESGYTCKITTPTHKSLNVVTNMLLEKDIVIQSSTIHSHLQLKQERNFNENLYSLQPISNSSFKQNIDILIVDESSMISDELFKYIEQYLENGNIKCIIFFGDPAQLDPVDGKTNPIYSNKRIKHYFLKNVVRQARENPIIELATYLRKMINNEHIVSPDLIKKLFMKYIDSDNIHIYDTPQKFMKKYFEITDLSDDDKVDSIILTYTNKLTDTFNQLIRQYKYNKKDVDDFYPGENVVLQSPVIKKDKILYRNNDVIRIGNLEKVREKTFEVFKFNAIKVVSKKTRSLYTKLLNSYKENAINGDRTSWYPYYQLLEEYADVKHIYSSTIHKAQGSTYENVFIYMNEILAYYTKDTYKDIYKLLYVALTRSSKNVYLIF